MAHETRGKRRRMHTRVRGASGEFLGLIMEQVLFLFLATPCLVNTNTDYMISDSSKFPFMLETPLRRWYGCSTCSFSPFSFLIFAFTWLSRYSDVFLEHIWQPLVLYGLF
ncbi:hypothetical protein F4810DRAFT_348015 [Camillea tinctor]|nr:hypothetical protein F4810DRAFT_348015 [Camillea tinctor]